jgi:alpha-glucosidase
MKYIKVFITVMITAAFMNVQAQESYLVEKDIAVFYPPNFDAAQTLPSVAVIAPLNNKGTLPKNWKTVPEFKLLGGKSIMEVRYDEGTDLYGTGEVTGSLRRNDKNITLWNTDNGLYLQHNGDRLYQSHPWILGVRADGSAFGILADNTWKQDVKLTQPISIVSEGPAFRVIVIEKKSPQEVVKALAQLTGTLELPPMWALGYQQSRFSYYPQGQVQEIADNFRSKKIPLDVIWMDINYMDNFKIFTFDPNGYADPKGLNKYLHSKSVKSVYMIDPGVKKETGYTVYDQGQAGNHWVANKSGQPFVGKVWPEACVFPDFTNPKTRTWWSGLYKDFMALGIDGVWNDMNEPSVFNGPDGSMPADNKHTGGDGLAAGPHLRYHNIFGMMMVKATREGILAANPDKRPFVLSRSNFIGGQRYAATWTGDNASKFDYLKTSIPMSINLGLSGQPFSGPDIGGFDGDCDAKLFSQWIAVGAYYPFCRNHTTTGSAAQEPWAYGTEVENISRNAINRRYRLLPYLYTLFREASQSGMPVMRPVFFADPKNKALRSEDQAFLLGGDLLVIPRWAEKTQLPQGNWVNVPFEDTDDGQQAVVKIRPGAIVPLGNVVQSTEEYAPKEITLLLNPDEKGNVYGEFYDDAKDGFGYKTGDFALLRFEGKAKAGKVSVKIKQAEGKRKITPRYRIGLVTKTGIKYSSWQEGDTVTL